MSVTAGFPGFWLKDREKQAIIAFHVKNPLEGYRRCTFMMLAAETIALFTISSIPLQARTPVVLESA
jgi:hypothetical protein